MPSYLKAAQYEPKTPQEQVEGLSCVLPLEGRNGFVFVLAYVSKKNPDSEALFQLLNDQAHRLTNSFGKEANAQHRFEQFLGALNETLSQFVREGRFYIPIQQFHAVVGIICEDQMFLSGAGELSGLFLHRKPSQRYQVFNIFRSIQTEQALPTWEKPFAVVLDGDLENGDVFCVCQKDLQQAIPADDLNSILTSIPPKSATEKIRQYFSHNDGLLLIIFKAEDPNSQVTEAHAKPLSDVSIDSFVRGQDETTRLLEDQKPNIIGFVRTWVIAQYKKQTERSRILTDLKRGESKSKMFLRLAQVVGRSLWRITKRLSINTKVFLIAISKKESRSSALEQFSTIKQRSATLGQNLIQKTKALPKKTKRSLGMILILVVVLGIGLFLLSSSHAKSTAQHKYDQQVSAIQDIMDRAGGAMIYRDENQARSLYQQATTLVGQLPTDLPVRQEKAKKLTADIETAMDELRHIVHVPNPALMGDLTTSAAGVSGIRLIRSNSLIFVAGTDQNLYRLDATQKLFTVANTAPITSSPILAASSDDKQVYLLDSANHLFSFDPSKNISAPMTALLDEGRWKSFITYANRLYLLQSSPDGTDSQIIRMNQAGTGFGAGQSWIVSKSDSLQQATSFTLDKSLYILKSNGQVSRFENGSEVGWTVGIVDPPISNATDIWTDANSKFLYVMEPAGKRLIVYKKDTGAFVMQYKSDTFDDLKGFAVDEKNYTIYLLSGSKLYSIAASHLRT